MKRNLLLLLFCSCMIQLQAQKTVVRTEEMVIGGSVHPSSLVVIDNADLESVEKKWNSYIKKNKGKVSRSKDEFFHDNAIIKSIGPDTLDIYSVVKSSGTAVTIGMAVNKNNEFITNKSGTYPGLEAFLYEFAVDIKKEMASDAVEAAAKVLEAKEKAHERLLETNKKLAEDNAEMKSKIADNDRTISDNEGLIEKAKSEISVQKELLESLEKKLKTVE